MAEMGAEVIKIEMTPGGDPSRVGPFIANGRSGYYVQQNRGKKGLCIDLKHPDGLAIAQRFSQAGRRDGREFCARRDWTPGPGL